jgi:hypothetical protein
MKPPCKSAAAALAESPVADLLGKARLLDRVAAAIAEISRELTTVESVAPPPRCAIEDRTLIITVGSAPHAAKLRQQLPRIEAAVQEGWPELSRIRIRLQPGDPYYAIDGMGPAASQATAAERQSDPAELAAALRFADDLARQLHDSPLRRSALRLQALLRGRLAQRD